MPDMILSCHPFMHASQMRNNWLFTLLLLTIQIAFLQNCTAEELVEVSSNECFVQEHAYRLVVNREGNAFELQSSNKTNSQPVSKEMTFEIPLGATAQGAMLSKWSSSGMCAIIKLEHEDKSYSFRCLCFVPRGVSGEFGDRINPIPKYNELILETNENWRILALNANDYGDGIIALLGVLRTTGAEVNQFNGTYVQKSAIYTHACPEPPVVGNWTFFENGKVEPQIGYEQQIERINKLIQEKPVVVSPENLIRESKQED